MSGGTTPGGFTGTKEDAEVEKLVREAERAKQAKDKDRFNLPPVGKGFLRGIAINIRQHEEPCEFGTLQVIEFDLADTPKGPGVAVRMAGTYFNRRLQEGSVLDVPDPTPGVRPITPDIAYAAHGHDQNELRAFYPGRGETPRNKLRLLGLLCIVVPPAVVLGIIVALRAYDIL